MKRKTILLIFIPFVITFLVWGINIATTQKKIIPITYVNGKTISEIERIYPVMVEGFTADGLKRYSYFDGGKDSLAKRMFDFKDGICTREIIIPKGNKGVELYLHYLNKEGMEFVNGGNVTPQSQTVEATIISGQWRIVSNDGITNIFMESGETHGNGKGTSAYFINTADHLPYWMATK